MPSIIEERDLNDQREERVNEAMDDANPSFVIVLARIAYAACAFVATYFGGHYFLGVEPEAAKEVALLNAGVAYYTHEAAGKVVSAIDSLYRRGFGRHRHH